MRVDGQVERSVPQQRCPHLLFAIFPGLSLNWSVGGGEAGTGGSKVEVRAGERGLVKGAKRPKILLVYALFPQLFIPPKFREKYWEENPYISGVFVFFSCFLPRVKKGANKTKPRQNTRFFPMFFASLI